MCFTPALQQNVDSMDGKFPVTHIEPARDTRRRFLRNALEAGLVGAALIHPAATLLGRLDWRADLITHFRELALAVMLIAIAGLARRHPRIALVLGCLATSVAPNSLDESQLPTLCRIPAGASLRLWG